VAAAADINAPVAQSTKQYDYSNLTAAEIEEIRQMRHDFYAAEKGAKEEQIKQWLLSDATKANLNQAEYDVRYYGINLSLDFGAETIDGYIDYQIVALVDGFSTVDLDLSTLSLSVSSVTVDGAPAATVSHTGDDDLIITTPTTYNQGEEFEMRVYYSGAPTYYGSQGMDFSDAWGAPMCWTNCEPWGSRYWWPCKDDPSDKPDSVDLYIEYPSGYFLVTVGELVSDTDIGGGRKLVHYKHMYPVATYLIAITCSDFQLDILTWNYGEISMPVYNSAMYWNDDCINSYNTYMLDVLTNLSNAFGTYPFHTEKAGNANYGWGGAMEHQTCSFYSPYFYTEWVIAHETAHQWWGDMITCRSFHHIWLNEGGASYAEPIHWEQQYGMAAYHGYMQTQKYLGGGTIFVEDPLNEDIFDQGLSYDKASWVWHMLRGVIGDEAFFQFMEDWHYSEFQYGSATTQDYADVLSASYGEDMDWFINQWIYGDGHPEYELSWKCLPAEGKADSYNLSYFVEQAQGTGSYFTMPVRTIFHTTGAELDTTLWYGPTSFFEMSFVDSVTNITIDPEEWVLREYSYVPFGLHLATIELPDAELGVAYAETLKVIGGVAPFSWAKLSGDIPFGLSLDYATGVLSGTPTWEATYYFTLEVTDSDAPPSTDQRAYAFTVGPPSTIWGDANGDGTVNVSDAVFLIQYIFAGGPAPDPLMVADANCDGYVNISDAVFIITYIFAGGPEPDCS
jgi:hypothetical protein